MKHQSAQKQVMRLLGVVPRDGIKGDAAEYFLKLVKDTLKENWELTDRAERLTFARVLHAIERIPIGQARDWEVGQIVNALRVLQKDVISEADLNQIAKGLYPIGRTFWQKLLHLPHPTEMKKVYRHK